MLATLLPHLSLFGLVALRTGIVLAALPSPFGDGAPVRVRAALSFLLAIAFTLPVLPSLPPLVLEPAPLFRSGIGELLVGAVIGLTVRVTLAAAEIAGNLAGTSMGLAFAASVDPTFGEEALPTSTLISSLAVLIFLAIQGHHALFYAMAKSLIVAPPGDVFDALSKGGWVGIGGQMVAHGLRIAAPVVATMFLVEIGNALVSKIAPRVHLFSFVFAVSSITGMVVLFIAAPSISIGLSAELGRIPDLLRDAFGGP